MNIIVIVWGILPVGLIIWGVYNIVVKRKKVTNMYTPFDDAMKGTKNDKK